MSELITDDTQVMHIPGPGNFTFSATRPEKLGASEYTLVTLVVDVTGSVRDFAALLLEMIKTVIKACKSNDFSENLLVRLILFNTTVMEVHGFIKVNDINEDDYDELKPTGMTALFDAAYSGIGATVKYAADLSAQHYDTNGAVYIITDGDDNRSKITESLINEQIVKARTGEAMDSLITILIGIFDPKDDPRQVSRIKGLLEDFQRKAGLDQYVHAGEATPNNLAKLGNLISESVSSQSQNLQTGQTSQPMAF